MLIIRMHLGVLLTGTAKLNPKYLKYPKILFQNFEFATQHLKPMQAKFVRNKNKSKVYLKQLNILKIISIFNQKLFI